MGAAPTTGSPGSAKTYRHDGISFHFLLKVGMAKLEGALQGGDGCMVHVRAAVRTDHLRRRGRRYAQPSGRNERKRGTREERRDRDNLGESFLFYSRA